MRAYILHSLQQLLAFHFILAMLYVESLELTLQNSNTISPKAHVSDFVYLR